MIYTTALKDNNYNSCGVRDHNKSVIVNGCGKQILVGTNLICIREKGMEDFLMIYVHKGFGNYRINGEMVKVGEGNILLFKPFEPQAIEYFYTDHPHMYWIHFTGYDAENILKETELINYTLMNIGTNDEIPKLYMKLINALTIKNRMYEFSTRATLMSLLSLVAESVYNISDLHLTPNYFDKLIEFIHTNFNQDYTNEYLASMCNLSTYHFIHTFKKVTGLPPKAYISLIRMNKAKELLCMTRLNINEIATVIGYDNPLYFSRAFKKQCLCSPTEYRSNRISVQQTFGF